MIAVHTPTMPDLSLPHVGLHDVGGRVQDLASSAAERLEDLPERAAALAGAVIPSLRPRPKRAKRPIVLLVLAAVVGAVAAAWFLRSRREHSSVDELPASAPSTVPAAS